jgi:hypothetical protein
MLRVVRPKATRHFRPDLRKKLEKQVRDIAWYITENHMGDPELTFKVKGYLTKSKKVIKHAELSGDSLTGRHRVHFVISNPYQFGFKMVADVYKDGKSVLTVQGHVHYCFDMISGLLS